MENFINQYSFIVVLVLFIIEWALGSTKIVKANSTVEAVLNIVSKVLKFVFRIEDKNKLS